MGIKRLIWSATTFLSLSFTIIFPVSSMAQDLQGPMYPAESYNEEVPTPEAFLGYALGTDLTEHHRMVDYIYKLQEAVPERVKVERIGESQEGRPMYLVIISSPEIMQSLETHRQNVAKLKDPVNTSRQQAREIAASTPAISWMNYANDGEESAAFEAALQVAYHYAAASDDQTMQTLQNSIVVINPAHNPDAHQRHVVWMKAMKVGPKGTADPNAAEHQADWLMSTSDTHYHIDSNRDGFALSQKESRIVAEHMRRWSPQLWVDYHGEPEEYFFAPYAIPVNPNYPESITQWAEVYGKNNGKAFDQFGWTYYAREVFDLHYPGYWDSFPAFNGAVGMTYETNGGGDKGFRYRKADGTLATLRNAIAHHVVASIATATTTADNREAILMDYYNFFAGGMAEVEEEELKQVALVPGDRPNDTEELVSLLLEHDIEVHRTDRAQRVEGLNYLNGERGDIDLPAGSYIVPMAQPQKRLAKVLLDRNVSIQQEFLNNALAAYEYNTSVGEKAPKKSLGFYDVTAWSLPLTYGLQAYGLSSPIDNGLLPVEDIEKVATEGLVESRANYAYLIPYKSNDDARLMSRLMAEGYRVAIATEPFVTNGKTYDRGTLVVRVERNPKSLHQSIRTLAREIGARVEAANAAWTESGILLGSRNVVNLQLPDILVLMDEPTRGRSYGAIWYSLEQRYGIPFTALGVEDFNDIDLYEYDMVIMPPGSYQGYKNMLGSQGIIELKSWIRNGGTFIGIKEGAIFAADNQVRLTSSRLLGSGDDEPTRVAHTPGSILRASLDTRHFLSLGYPEEIPVHVNSSHILKPSKEGANVAVYDSSPVVSGFVFEDNKSNFPGNAYLIHEPLGRGDVVLFAEQPVFRLYWRGLERLFINSLLLTPGF
jgi:hypothetical protein